MKLHHKSRQSGFTLIELLTVVAILGILAGIAVPRVLGAIQNARVAADAANIAMLQSAVDRWAMENNPGSTRTGWDPLIGAETTSPIPIRMTDTAIVTDLVPLFLSAIPVAPSGLRTVEEDYSGYALQVETVGSDTNARTTVTVIPHP